MSDREDLPIDDNLAVQPTNNDAVEETPKPIPKRGRGRPRKDGTTPAVKRTVVKKTHRRPDDEFETTTYYKRKAEVEASGERRTSKRPRKCRRKILNEKEMCDKGMFCSFSFFYCNCPFPTSCNLLLLDCHRVHSIIVFILLHLAMIHLPVIDPLAIHRLSSSFSIIVFGRLFHQYLPSSSIIAVHYYPAIKNYHLHRHRFHRLHCLHLHLPNLLTPCSLPIPRGTSRHHHRPRADSFSFAPSVR
ncbi:hypothetical protein SMACR_09011 [Sordaria macrospora]|uniref:WGS project CABT00000000 data, contig 2.31 n=2 Tax=Sordaria macrospora TaxID=5147 RepID=F7W5M8_SORMK|nr:uncharacterized protein SMAC_09011 [Sordaria macrospora k-hell]KAA8635492.1 hypothetical protein SMACR_09011 [Sordaria macrospora]KAH7629554.1 hypothetical protein B0T09DRAFT_401364 [Sordaria sp. MPI-SDFR-AT-0083]WPJ66234.1 hypothetical protein SMAC4_09011 [Sordaria macrospora]CCC12816.1 unnamed protein product [Sordaria macrospora k-hell]